MFLILPNQPVPDVHQKLDMYMMHSAESIMVLIPNTLGERSATVSCPPVLYATMADQRTGYNEDSLVMLVDPLAKQLFIY